MLARMTYGGYPVADVPGEMTSTEEILSARIARQIVGLRDRRGYIGQVN